MLAARTLRLKGKLKLNEYKDMGITPASDGTPIVVSVRTRAQTGKGDWSKEKSLGFGTAIGQIVHGEDRMLVITLEDPIAPNGKVDVLGSEVWWWLDSRALTDSDEPEVSAYEYAQSLEESLRAAPTPVAATLSAVVPATAAVLPTVPA